MYAASQLSQIAGAGQVAPVPWLPRCVNNNSNLKAILVTILITVMIVTIAKMVIIVKIVLTFKSYSNDSNNFQVRTRWAQVGAPGVSASQVEALVLEIASEVTGHGVDPQDAEYVGIIQGL